MYYSDSNNQRLLLGDSTFLPPNASNKGGLHAQGTVNNMQHTRMDHKKYSYQLILLFLLLVIY